MVLFDPSPENYLHLATPAELSLGDITEIVSRMPVTWVEVDGIITFSRELLPLTLRLLDENELLAVAGTLGHAHDGPPPRTVLRAEWPEYLPEFGDVLPMTVLLDLCFHMRVSPGLTSFLYTPAGITAIPEDPANWTVSLRRVDFPRFTIRGAFPGDVSVLSTTAQQEEFLAQLPVPPPTSPQPGPPPTPRPGALTALPAANVALVIRTDFTDDERWRWLQEELSKPAFLDGTDEELYYSFSFVDDRQFDGVTADQIVDDHGHREDETSFDGPTYLYLADARTMTHPEHPLLAVNLYLIAGETFRLVPDAMPVVDANLGIANMSFSDYMHSSGDGIHRGF
jgi:hypothetical protein